MMQVPDPAWKCDPDIVADESFEDRYEEEDLWDDDWTDAVITMIGRRIATAPAGLRNDRLED